MLLRFLYLVLWYCGDAVVWLRGLVMLYRDDGMNKNKEMLLWGVC